MVLSGNFKKLFVLICLLMFVPMLILNFYVQRLFINFYNVISEQRIYEQVFLIKMSIGPIIDDGINRVKIAETVGRINELGDTKFYVVDVAGNTIAAPKDFKINETKSNIILIKNRLTGSKKDYVSSIEDGNIQIFMPVYDDRENILLIIKAVYEYDMQSLFSTIFKDFMIVFSIAALTCGIIVLRSASKYTGAVNDLNDFAKKITNGNREEIIRITGNTSLNELASSLNKMAFDLKMQMQKIENEQNKLVTVLDSINDGVIATDSQGKILFINPAAENIFHIDKESYVGQPFLEAIRNYDLYETIKNVTENGTCIRCEVIIKDSKIYSISVSPILSERAEINGAVMNLRDVTEIKSLEKIKSDLVANVSHELRTPLTSIKGFTETLIDGAIDDPAASSKFLVIIEKEINNLIDIVNDLLDLSEIESGRIPIHIEEVDISLLVNDVMNLLQTKADEKGIKIIKEFGENAYIMNLDKFRMQQVLINLIDNAIKYTDEGFIKISTSITPGKYYNISVADSGTGIPIADQARLFDRFYRVEKGRDRKSGGTGLGLSIVKHIVQLHDGVIDMSSREGVGTNIMIKIPIKN